MSNQLTIEVYNNIASGASPIKVIETEISSSFIFVQALEDVAPINVQVYENTTSGTFPISKMNLPVFQFLLKWNRALAINVIETLYNNGEGLEP